METIIVNKPMNPKPIIINPSHDSTIAAVPILTVVVASSMKGRRIGSMLTAATCCHMLDTSVKIEEKKQKNAATCETGRDGNGLISISLPVRASCSSCQPGKVEIRRIASVDMRLETTLCFVSGLSALPSTGRTDNLLEPREQNLVPYSKADSHQLRCCGIVILAFLERHDLCSLIRTNPTLQSI